MEDKDARSKQEQLFQVLQDKGGVAETRVKKANIRRGVYERV